MGEGILCNKNILITGGTSGLGFELVNQFAQKGCTVVATGRSKPVSPGFPGLVKYYRVDFKNLDQVARLGEELNRNEMPFDIIINNAGILSPPFPEFTVNRFECTFQVNFLAHLLLNQMLILKKQDNRPLVIVPVTSPVYKLGRIKAQVFMQSGNYSALRAYADTKLYLIMMSSFFNEKFRDKGITCVNFNPGIFSSGIYRTQERWFRIAYHLASPLLEKPSAVASKVAILLESRGLIPGAIYNRKGNPAFLPSGSVQESAFWSACFEMIDPFISRKE